MTSLEEARDWYLATRSQLGRMARLARRYWGALPWDGALGNDDSFRDVGQDEVVEHAEYSLAQLDDIAILILFSAFESLVRGRVLSAIQAERDRATRPILARLIEDSLDGFEHGSFSRVLGVFKGVNPDLVEEVNQVRRYRNWVAHGRRTVRPAAVDPGAAYRRLRQFLDLMPLLDD